VSLHAFHAACVRDFGRDINELGCRTGRAAARRADLPSRQRSASGRWPYCRSSRSRNFSGGNGREKAMQARLAVGVMELYRLLRRAGPYVVLEVVLPGGTLFALLLYLYRTGQLRQVADLPRLAVRAAGRAFDQLAFTMQPIGAMPGPAPHVRDGLEPLDLAPHAR
jgi:hypothetical protein